MSCGHFVAICRFKLLETAPPDVDHANNQAHFAALTKSLPVGEHRFVVFDFTATTDEGRKIEKLILIKWCEGGRAWVRGKGSAGSGKAALMLPLCRAPRCRCPDDVPVKTKGVVGSSYQTLKGKLVGLGKDLEATDSSDLDYAKIRKALA